MDLFVKVSDGFMEKRDGLEEELELIKEKFIKSPERYF